MNEYTGATILEAWWCLTCEFVEKDDDAQDITSDACQSCGCDGSNHIRIEVVGK